MKRILFLTSTNLASNPRLVKEMHLATSIGYTPTVIQFEFNNWSDQITREIEKEFPDVSFITLSAHRSPFFPWLFSSLLQWLYNRIPLRFLTARMLSVAVNKRTLLLLNALPKIKDRFEWVIAHNPAAFYPAYIFSRKRSSKLGIDVEDYHPGETTVPAEQNRMLKLMQYILPFADYCSYAAPLIAARVQEDISFLETQQLVIINGFPENEFAEPKPNMSKRLKLIWFSQNISEGRGLEKVIEAVKDVHMYVELHLIGSLNPSFNERYLKENTFISIHPPMTQKKLHLFLSEFDVGLATDLPVNQNRDIALTNKIIAYAQAGLVIASMYTKAQDHFLKESELTHIFLEPDAAIIKGALMKLYEDKHNGKFNNAQQYIASKKYSWEIVSQKLTNSWQNISNGSD